VGVEGGLRNLEAAVAPQVLSGRRLWRRPAHFGKISTMLNFAESFLAFVPLPRAVGRN
jgi:hypothetical protein